MLIQQCRIELCLLIDVQTVGIADMGMKAGSRVKMSSMVNYPSCGQLLPSSY